MGLLKKWRKRKRLRSIPAEHIYEPLYETLRTFNEDMLVSIRVSKKRYPTQKIIPITKKLIIRSHVHRDDSTKKLIYRPHYKDIYDATYKIVLFGDAGVPKTQLTQKYLTNIFKSDSKMTIGVDFEVKSLEVDKKRVKLQIWDFGGEERFRFLLPTYVRGANGALYIYDVRNYSSLAHIDDWLMVLRKELRAEDRFPIIVVGIVSELDNEREVPSEEAIKIAKSRGVDGFAECSPRTGENVEETFEALTRLMLVKSGVV